MLDVVCFKFKPRRAYRSTFGPENVNVLRRMVQRNLRLPHRFSCITDDATGIDADIRIIPIWDDYADVPNPSLPMGPSCYRRLKLWSREARELIGERILCLDLDMVIRRDITSMIDVPDPIVMADGISLEKEARAHRPYCRLNGSMLLLTASVRPDVWESFDPRTSPKIAHFSGSKGSDQGWISYCLGSSARTWTRDDGVYSYQNHIAPFGGACPDNARVILFCGKTDPWSPEAQQLDFVREHYR